MYISNLMSIIERAEKMIAAHEIKFGEYPSVISMPPLEVGGVPIHFDKSGKYFSSSNKNCLHHDFVDTKPSEE